MRFALRKPNGDLLGEVGSTGLSSLTGETIYYETLRDAVVAANRRHKIMDGLGGRTKHWFAVTIVQELFPQPAPAFVMVDDTDCCS